MFDIVLSIFLIGSAIFIFPVLGNIQALQFFQFGVIGHTGYNYLQLQFFQLGVLVLFITALFSKPQRAFNDKNAGVMFIAFILSVLLHPVSVKLIGNIFLGFFLYYLVTVYSKDKKWVYRWVIFVSILNTVFALLQFMGIYLIYQPTGRIDGLMCTSTHLGVYQAIALPICYSMNPWLAVIPATSILLSKSAFAVIVSLIWFASVHWRMAFNYGSLFFMFIASLIFFPCCYFYHMILDKIIVRWYAWKPILLQILEHPFLGNGVKTVKIQSQAGLFENPQSAYLQYLYYLGVLAIIPLYLFINNKLKCRDRVLLSCFFIALAAGIEKSYFDFPRLAATVIILTALMNTTKGEIDVS